MADLAEMSLASTGVWGAGAAATVRRRVVKYILLVWVRCWLGLQRRRLAVVGRLSWIICLIAILDKASNRAVFLSSLYAQYVNESLACFERINMKMIRHNPFLVC